MENYLSKQAILSIYLELSKLDPEHKQGATQLVSSIRYFVALDRFYKDYQRACDTKDKNDRDTYSKYICDIVGVCEELYANQFYYPLRENNGDCCTGSNFYSTNVVLQSLENKRKVYTYPKSRKAPLFDVKDGCLIKTDIGYKSFDSLFANNSKNKLALALWLLRSFPLPNTDKPFHESVTEVLGSIYSDKLVSILIPSKEIFEKICSENHFDDFSTTRAKLSKEDIKALFSNQNEVALANMKEICPIVLYGPPGTGKTYKLQHDYCSNFDENNQYMVTFHQSFCYEDFVEGLKPVESETSNDNITYRVEKGIFYQACERASVIAGYKNLEDCLNATFDDRNAKFGKVIKNGEFVLLCIDEINRGNVSAIFGELISLIEDKKRLGAEDEMTTMLPYSKKNFGVPANLFVVCTMNTADRSIQLLDSAIRRRFKFEELLPNYGVISNPHAKTILTRINDRIRCIMNKDTQVGHSYLMHAKNDKDILLAMMNKVIPLLEEYFYNDIDKIRFVLNESRNREYAFYKEDEGAKAAYEDYVSNEDIDEEEKSFYILDKSIKDISDEKECTKYLTNLLG